MRPFAIMFLFMARCSLRLLASACIRNFRFICRVLLPVFRFIKVRIIRLLIRLIVLTGWTTEDLFGSLDVLTYLSMFHRAILAVNFFVMLRMARVSALFSVIGAALGVFAFNTKVYAGWITVAAACNGCHWPSPAQSY